MTNTTPLRNPKKRIFDEATWLLMFVLDSTVILTSVAMAYALRYLFVWPDLFGGIIRAVPAEFYVQWSAFIPIALLLLVLMQAQFTIRGMYRLPPNSPLTAHLRIIFNSTTTAAAILVVVVFSYRPLYYSRLVIALVFAPGAWRATRAFEDFYGVRLLLGRPERAVRFARHRRCP